MENPLLLYKSDENGVYYVKNLVNKTLISIFKREKIDLLENKGVNALMDDFRQIDFFKPMSEIPLVVILTTYECNLDCPYCYEHEKPKATYDQDIILKDIDFIINRFKKENFKKIEVNFSGGEPLLNFNVLRTYVERLSERAANYFDIQFSLTTNGTLLSNSVLEFLNEYRFSIQISFDGDNKHHNINRRLRNGIGTYEILLQNIHQIVYDFNNLKLTLRCNVIHHIPGLYHSVINDINDLVSVQKRKNIYIYFALIDTNETVQCDASEKIIDLLKSFYIKAFNDGYLIPNTYIDGGNCMIKDNVSFCIAPPNKIFKCYSLVSYNELSRRKYDLTSEMPKEKVCTDSCGWKPLCFGGCLYRSYIKDRVFTRNCRKTLLESMNKFFFLLELKQIGVLKDWNGEKDEKNIVFSFI